jgi:outer membrane translocation and assembly module TamA
MSNLRYWNIWLVGTFLLLFAGCSNLKYVPAGEQLYTGASINIEPKETVKRKNIRAQLEQVVRPKPNSTFLGLRPRLWFYNIAGDNADKGIKKWLKTKLGEPPVYLSQVDPFLIQDLMKSKLDNMGYFKSRTEHEIKSKDKKASVEYIATVSDPYKLNDITYPQGTDSLSVAIRRTQSEALIYKGIQFNLDLLKDERARIDNELKDLGYFFFNPDLLVYTVDTTYGDRLINVLLSVKPDSPEKALITYSLDSIYIVPRYSVSRRRILRERDTIYDYGYYFVERSNNLKHKALARYIKLKEGHKYSKRNHNLTVSRLMSMGVFSFVDIDYQDTIINNEGVLKSRIRLTQMLPKTLKVDLDIGSKSNNFVGPALSTNFINRNLFKGGELLRLNFSGAYETQLSGNEKGFKFMGVRCWIPIGHSKIYYSS